MSQIHSFDSSLLPTEEEVCSYEEFGFYITPKLLPDDLLDRCRVAIDEHHLGRRDHKLCKDANYSDWKVGDGNGVRNNEFCSLQNDGVHELANYPIIAAIAARLARSPAIRLFDDQAIFKPTARNGGSNAVGWHTDHSYWSTCTSSSMLTAWIPLHDTSISQGTLFVVKGSHHWPESEHLRGFNDSDLDSIEKRLQREVPKSLIVPIVMEKGQFSFHHMRTLHASAPNVALTPRVALAVHLQDAANSYRAYSTPKGESVVLPHDLLCRQDENGLPDYTDPNVFPTLWSETTDSV